VNIEQWLDQISEAYKESGKTFSANIKDLLLSEFSDDIVANNKEALNESIEVITCLFFSKATKGETFGLLNRIRERFGDSLEHNYNIKKGPFLNMAKTYWTFNLEITDLMPQHVDKCIFQILRKIEFDISSIFFPSGPANVTIDQRKQVQKQILDQYAPQINIDEFFTNNPILGAKGGILDSPLMRRITPSIVGIIYIIIAVSIIAVFGLNIFTEIIGGLLAYLAFKSFKVSIYGSRKLINTMLGKENDSADEAREEYRKLS